MGLTVVHLAWDVAGAWWGCDAPRRWARFWDHFGVGGFGMMARLDSAIQQDIIKELRWDTRVKETEVGVSVDGGVVTLTGTVDSYAKKLAAQDAAHRVYGVLDVANDIQVKLPADAGRTDTEIARAVREALEWNVVVPDQRITSTVSAGWVTLEGGVETWHQREDTERAVRFLQGVKGVTNRLVVHAPAVEAEEIRGEIEEALERRAEREAKRILVSVADGTVTLTGVVRSTAERRAVVGAARATSGVRDVVDRLRVQPQA
ncbi:MAG: BON domain-containing protein [Chloroflexota bacterium]